MEVSARPRRALLTAVGVVAALVVVAVAARGSTPAGDGRVRRPSDALLDILFTLYIAAIVAGAGLVLYALVLRRHVQVQTGQVRRRSMLEIAVTMIVVGVLGLLVAPRLRELDRPEFLTEEDIVLGEATVTATATAPGETAPPTYEPGFSWLPALATAVLIVVAAAAWWLARRARREARGELPFLLATAVAQAVDESLWDLRAEPDPRRAVIAAYARLERVLAAHDLPRRPAEAPLEYLARMLVELDVGERAARTLTELFERAKFSQHAVGPEMKEQAIEALETVRDEVLAARARAERAHAEALAAARARAEPSR